MQAISRLAKGVAGTMLHSTTSLRGAAAGPCARSLSSCAARQPGALAGASFRPACVLLGQGQALRLQGARRGVPLLAAAGAANAPPAAALPDDAAGLATLVDAQMTWPARSHGAGALREADAGVEVTVCGWVDRNRNMGGLCFLDVRDHTGLLQVRACRALWCRAPAAAAVYVTLKPHAPAAL